MSLLDDLKGLDLSAVVNARATITVTASGPHFQGVLDAGVAGSALGDLGAALTSLRGGFQDPAALLQPLLGGLASLAGEIKPEDLPIADFVAAVDQGAKELAALLAALRGDPDALRRLFGLTLDEALGSAVAGIGELGTTMADGAGALAQLIQLVDGGLPRDAEPLVEAALRLLVPGGGGPLRDLRAHLDGILQVGASLTLPQERVAGLVLALDGVATAAAGGDVGALRLAVDQLTRVRVSTVGTLTDELAHLTGRIQGLHLETALAPLLAASRAVTSVEGGVIDLVQRLRALTARARALLQEVDPEVIVAAVPMVFDFLEAFAQREIAAPFDAMVDAAKRWLRDLLGKLPLRALRQALRDKFHAVAEAIGKANLGQYGDDVIAKLAPIEQAIDSVDLGKNVRDAVQNAAQGVRAALDGIDGAVKTIKATVDGVASAAVGVLNRGADALASFKKTMDDLAAKVDQIGVEQAAQVVIQALSALREKAEELLSKAPLPEPLKPLIQQLVKQIESIDLDSAILAPVRAVTKELQLGAAIEAPIKAGLAAMRDALDHLVPAQLIASIEAEIGAALDKLRAFDPTRLLGELGKFIDEAADAIAALDPKKLTDEIRAPFQAVLGLLDTLAPEKLLEPAFHAWDAMLGALQLPGPDAAVQKTTDLLGSAGDKMRQAALAPVAQIAPGAQVKDRTGATRPDAPAGPAKDVLIGDVMRVLGYLPQKLHEALGALDADAASAVVQALGAVTGGLARDLQRVEDVVWGFESSVRSALDAALSPLGAAELRADVAVQAHFSAGGVDVTFALDGIYDATPARLREQLLSPLDGACRSARAAAEQVVLGAGPELDRAARRIALAPLAQATGSIDALRAALDVEPLAADFEALVGEAFGTVMKLLPAAGGALETALARLRALIAEYNPATQMLKFVTVLDVLRDELELLDPRRLAQDLGEIHAVIKKALSAYDPTRLADALSAMLTSIASKLRALSPDQLLGDLHFLDDIGAKIDAVVPAKALAGVGDALKDVGERLTELDPAALLAAVDGIGKKIDDAFAEVAEKIKQEIVALLESIKYAGGSASASVSVQGSASA